MNTMTATASPARVKGPIVWLDMDQQELDDAYDQIVYAPNRDQVGKRRLANSAAALTRIGKPLRLLLTARHRSKRWMCIEPPSFSSPASGGGKEWGRAGGDFHSRRCVAERAGVGVHLSGRAFRAGRRVHCSSCSTSPMSTMPAAACSRWSSKCGARSAGFIAMPHAPGGDRDRLQLISHSSGSHLAEAAW